LLLPHSNVHLSKNVRISYQSIKEEQARTRICQLWNTNAAGYFKSPK